MSQSLRIPLSALHRGPVRREWTIERPGEVFGELPAALEPLELELEVRGDARDGVRVTGKARSTAEMECRRCLDPVRGPVEFDVDLWFRTESEVTPGADGVWPVGPDSGELDLLPPLREDLLLAMPDYPVCEDGCKGLCASCGARLAEEECTCPPPGPDPRWEALEALRTEGDTEPDA